ncbi:MAG: hypothetical protein EBE86_005075 [Hormoscilla sp. GUM202]|nr:hypothetical protein [Hormoscilla sp. GUM202]
MSFNLLVISEDPTNNGYIFIPLIKRMMKECGKPNSRVALMTDPKASGYENAKYLIREVVIERYAYKDLLLFLPDADGKDRSQEFASLEGEAMAKGVNLLCCAAVQEVEAWLLAGHLDKLDTPWSEIRADISVKENVFEDFLDREGDPKIAGRGREALMRETLLNYRGLLDRCPELKELQRRIQNLL